MTPRGQEIINHQYLANIHACFRAAWRTLAPKPALNVWQWGEAYRKVATDVSAKPGRYTLRNAPYQREPQEAFLDDQVQVTVLQWGSRLGKTEMINNLDGWIMDMEPCGILVVYPTIDKCKAWSKKFFMPMVRSTNRLRPLIRAATQKLSENTILSKKFPNGYIDAVSANSPSSLRQVQARLIQCDEIDAYEPGVEGDPVMLALKRADNYSNSIKVLASTPSIEGLSRIESWMARSDNRRWFVDCVRCGHSWWMQILEDLDYDEGKPETAGVKCPGCQARLTDAERIQMVKAGRWQPISDFNGIRGYWLDALSSLFEPQRGYISRCHQLADEMITAKSNAQDQQGWQQYVNTVGNRSYSPANESVASKSLATRKEDYSIAPKGVHVITCGVDVQGDRLELEIVGWGNAEESWSIDYRQIHGSPLLDQVWLELRDILSKPIERTDGSPLKIARTLIDAGYATDDVFKRVSLMRAGSIDIWASMGARKPRREMVETKMRGKGIRKYWMIGTNAAKQTIFSRLNNKNPESPGYCHFPQRYTDAYFDMLTAEVGRPAVLQGVQTIVYEPRYKGIRNEALDCRVMAFAALRTKGFRLESSPIKEPKLTMQRVPPSQSNVRKTPKTNWVLS